LAQAAIARGDLIGGERQIKAALDQLNEYPAPLVLWKTYVVLGRLRSQSGDLSSAREAFAQASAIVKSIASNTDDKGLRQTFLNSPAVKEVLDGAEETARSSNATD